MKSAQHFGQDGGAPRIRSAIAHSLIYVLAIALISRIATWFGLFLYGAHFVSAVLLVSWVVAGFHRHSEHLCERCMRDVPVDAPARAERQRPLLRFAHFAKSAVGCAVLAVLCVGPPLLAELMPGEVSRLLYIPGDLWLFAIIYTEWVHHRLRPWCPYCRPWGEEGEEEPAPGAGPVIAPYVATEAKPAAEAEAVPARIRQWKNALLDLSLRNKLINYTDRAGYRLEVPGPALGRFEDAVNAGARVSLLGSDEVQNVDIARGARFGRDLPENEREILLADKRSAYIDITAASYKNKLRYLANKAKTIREETGANNLYLAFGMLSWHLNDRPLRSPLVLVPVSLSTTNRGERYLITIDDTGASTPNYCLIEKLRTALGLDIPALAQPDEDASGIDLVATFDAVRRAVAEAGLPFRVEDTVHLSILQFAKFPLWKDLDESWKGLSRNSLVRHLLESPQNQFVDPVTDAIDVDLNELNTAVPVPADASQLRAVADAVGGRTFVLEGPPGTGKSQTITNLLAHAMATGRRVLFVAEKRAALDVVKKRLESVGLGELSLDIHDKSARPAAVRAQIKHALELRLSHDADLLRTKLQVAESSRHSLDRYAARLHEANAVGQSLYTARSFELAADQDIAPLAVPRSLITSIDPTTFDDVAAVMRTLPEKFDDARPRPDHPWAFIDAVPQPGLDPARIHPAAVAFDTALAELQAGGIARDVLGRCESPEVIDEWARLTNEPRYPLAAVDALSSADWQVYVAGIEQLLASLQQKPAWLATATPAAMDLDIPAIHAAGGVFRDNDVALVVGAAAG